MWEIRLLGRVWVHGKKGIRMIGITMIGIKRGIQWDRYKIRVWEVPILCYFTPTDLYSDLNNTAVSQFPKSKETVCVVIS
jgi:hypothetical protein